MPASRATIGCNINALKVNVICSAPCLPARSQSSSRHSPVSHPIWCDSLLVDVPSQENLIGTKRVHNQTVGAPDRSTMLLGHDVITAQRNLKPRLSASPTPPKGQGADAGILLVVAA